ncbi:MAG: hypothetical protein ACFNPT_05050, partial [Neisseria elongata]
DIDTAHRDEKLAALKADLTVENGATAAGAGATIGPVYQIDAEKVLSLTPDLVIINKGMNEKLLETLAANDIGPGVYDIHSPRVPTEAEVEHLLRKAMEVVPVERLWVNPDCGLKTRGWKETIEQLEVMMAVTKKLRQELAK